MLQETLKLDHQTSIAILNGSINVNDLVPFSEIYKLIRTPCEELVGNVLIQEPKASLASQLCSLNRTRLIDVVKEAVNHLDTDYILNNVSTFQYCGTRIIRTKIRENCVGIKQNV